MMPKVSIVIPFYNCPYVDQAIASALAQTYPNVEVIVVDDGSNQHSERIVPFLDRTHYIGKANGGTASALNCGIHMASGEYVAWLSSDDLFKPNKLAVQIPFMQENEALISYTPFDKIDGTGQLLQSSIAVRFPNQAELIRSFLDGDAINGCTVVMKKELCAQVGMFNEKLNYTHDYDLWMRVALAGIPIHFLDESLIMYRWHDQMGTLKHSKVIKLETRSTRKRYCKQLKGLVKRWEASPWLPPL
ncbi:glycosyltransferase [Paenibacillus sp. GP183]|jgi:teichuronic acid biosynthesis glycosyltransferase TuaG|uniref:glycosyltransferase family 2 protein n=1 Tax=Paenibacillus sp. GP183 TaxID=1882751 RepID=UPI000897673F|nr:glycosyltransferase [Paenibacillus sp. GP183]SEC69211.1 Glycosyl transferase family 2 [Paenibacillus sp. GP183]